MLTGCSGLPSAGSPANQTASPSPAASASPTDTASDIGCDLGAGGLGVETQPGGDISTTLQSKIDPYLAAQYSDQSVLGVQRVLVLGGNVPPLIGKDVVVVRLGPGTTVQAAPGPPYSDTIVKCSLVVFDSSDGTWLTTYGQREAVPTASP